MSGVVVKMRIFIVMMAVSIFASCSQGSNAILDQLIKIDAIAVPTERLAALIQLDQGQPNFAVKFRLGELHMQFGQLDVAEVYLREAAKLGKRSGIAKADARAATLEYARTLILVAKPAEAIAVVMPLARSADPEALLIRARAHVQAGNARAALEDFSAAMNAANSRPAAADYTLYAQALALENRFADSLEVIRKCEASFGYQPGAGLLESSVLEKLGRGAESVLAAFKETLYQLTQGAISQEQVDKNLAVLATRADVSGLGGPREQIMIQGLRFYVQARWAEANRSLTKGLTGTEDPFARFLLLTSSLEDEKVSPAMLADFATLEMRYRTYPDFYYHLWRAMKKGPGDYSLSNARNVLEKTILLAPTSAEAAESRQELGRFLGIDAQEARSIMLRPELDRAFALVLDGGDPQKVLLPVIRLLSIRRENIYTSEGALMLKSAARIPAVGAFLADQAKHASGPLKDRLLQVL
jgi:hypothetical protein